MIVSQATKNAYFSSTATKHLRVHISGTNKWTIPEGIIIADSMTLKEELMPSSKIEFGGMYGISFEIEIFSEDRPEIDKGNWLTAYLGITDNTEEEYDDIPLFVGLVAEVKKLNTLGHYKVLAYDPIGYNSDSATSEFGYVQGVDGWNVTPDTPLSEVHLGDFFNSNRYSNDLEYENTFGYNTHPPFAYKVEGIDGQDFFSFDVTEENKITIGKPEDRTIDTGMVLDGLRVVMFVNRVINYPQPTKFVDFYRDFFEFIGAYGIGCRQVDEEGYLHIDKRCGGSNYILEESDVPYYKSLWIEDVNRPYKDGLAFIPVDTNYDNNETLNQSRIIIKDNWVAQNTGWYKSYQGTHVPFMRELVAQPNYTLVTNGMPWVEVGKSALNVTEIKVGNRTESRRLIVMNRTLKGIQNMTDTFTLNFSISESGDYATTTQQRISNIETYMQNGFFNRDKSVYVTELPEQFETNTVYFLRKTDKKDENT